MKVIHNPSMPGECSQRQVLFYSTDGEDPFPETMEDIKISIVNELATGSKRECDEDTAVTPCAKRFRPSAFTCSTPISASIWAVQSRLGKENPDSSSSQDEPLDDSLLERCDYEESVSSLSTEEALYDDDDDDDDTCYAAEPVQKYNITTHVATFTPSESKNEDESDGASHWITLDFSDTLIAEPECEGDVSNYAAMPPSPNHSGIDPAEVTTPNQSSVGNVKSHHESLTSKTELPTQLGNVLPTPLGNVLPTPLGNVLPTPLLEVREVPASGLPSSRSIKLPRPPSIPFYGLHVAADWTEDPDPDNLLAISPRTVSSLEEGKGGKLSTITSEGHRSVVSDAAQHLSSQSLNLSGVPKSHHHHSLPPEPQPLKESLPSTVSLIVTAEPNLATQASGAEQNLASLKASEAEETRGIQNLASSSRPTTSTNGNQSKVIGSSGPSKKPQVAVAALPRPSFRAYFSEAELDRQKANYFFKVRMHLDALGTSNLEDPLSELAALSNRISQENPNWQHQSDLTTRNYPRIGSKQPKRFTLSQWVTKSGGVKERFKDIPDTFERSPVPADLPFGSS